MINIEIRNDYFAYITCDDTSLFILIRKSFTREVRKYNNYYRIYETKQHKHYSLVNDGKTIKVKAGLITFLCNSLSKRNIPYTIKDSRLMLSDITSIVTKLNDEVTLRDYQKDAVKAVFESGYCSVQLPTGTGKTEVSASIIKTYLSKYFTRAVVYVVPTNKLQKEAKERFENYGLQCNFYTKFVSGQVSVVTYAALLRSKIDYISKNRVGALIFDEGHHLKADKSSRIVHEYKKLQMCVGLSATLSSNIECKTFLNKLEDDDFNVFGSTGYPVYYKSIDETISEKFVTPVRVHVLVNPEVISLSEDESSNWHSIKKKVLHSDQRANLVAEYTKHIIDKYNYNTVCLLIPEVRWSIQYMLYLSKVLGKRKDVRLLLTYGGEKYDEVIDNKLVHLSSEERDKAYESIKDPNVITIFSATSYFKEGIDVPNLQALINVAGGKSEIAVKQMLGRTMRLFRNKKVADIFEIHDKNPVLERQFKKRIDTYVNSYNAEVIISDFVI